MVAAVATLGIPASASADAVNGFQCSDETPTLHFNTVLPDGTLGQPYSAQIEVTGGTPPYTFEPVNGPVAGMPAGLTLSSSGQVSGVPTQSGTIQLWIGVTDSGSPAECASEFVYLHVNTGAEGAQQTLQQTVSTVLGVVNSGSGGLTGCILGTVGAVLGQGPPSCH
jgi:hypothetical protein